MRLLQCTLVREEMIMMMMTDNSRFWFSPLVTTFSSLATKHSLCSFSFLEIKIKNEAFSSVSTKLEPYGRAKTPHYTLKNRLHCRPLSLYCIPEQSTSLLISLAKLDVITYLYHKHDDQGNLEKPYKLSTEQCGKDYCQL